MYRVTEINFYVKYEILLIPLLVVHFWFHKEIKKLIRWLASFVIGIQLGFYLFLVPGNMYIRIL